MLPFVRTGPRRHQNNESLEGSELCRLDVLTYFVLLYMPSQLWIRWFIATLTLSPDLLVVIRSLCAVAYCHGLPLVWDGESVCDSACRDRVKEGKERRGERGLPSIR